MQKKYCYGPRGNQTADPFKKHLLWDLGSQLHFCVEGEQLEGEETGLWE